MNRAVSFMTTEAVAADATASMTARYLGDPLLSDINFIDSLVKAPESSMPLETSRSAAITNMELKSTNSIMLSVSP